MVTMTAIMLGAYMILDLQMDVEQVASSFRSIESMFIEFAEVSGDGSITVLDCWTALHRVRNLGWLDLTSDGDISNSGSSPKDSIDMDEYSHYTDPANGGLHTIVPGRLLFIPSPMNLPDGRCWMDMDDGRRFSPDFFADLLASEFRTALVVGLRNEGSVTEYDASAFEERGIAVEDIPMGELGAPHHLLAAADRLLALLRSAPGAVAVHVQGLGACGGGSAGVLLATGLIRVFGFSAGEAAAWLRMVCPPLHVPHAQLSAAVAHSRYLAALSFDDMGRPASLPLPGVAAIAAAGTRGERPAWAAAQNPILRTLSLPTSIVL
jgi:hypothetical protein